MKRFSLLRRLIIQTVRFASKPASGRCSALDFSPLETPKQTRENWNTVWKGLALSGLLIPSIITTNVAVTEYQKNSTAVVSEEFLSELVSAVGKDRVVLDEGDRELHGKPWNSYHQMESLPDVIVYAQ